MPCSSCLHPIEWYSLKGVPMGLAGQRCKVDGLLSNWRSLLINFVAKQESNKTDPTDC